MHHPHLDHSLEIRASGVMDGQGDKGRESNQKRRQRLCRHSAVCWRGTGLIVVRWFELGIVATPSSHAADESLRKLWRADAVAVPKLSLPAQGRGATGACDGQSRPVPYVVVVHEPKS